MPRDTDATVALNALRDRFKADYYRGPATPNAHPDFGEISLEWSWYRADWAVVKRVIKATTKLQAQYRQPRPNETARQAAARLRKNAALVHEAHEAVVAQMRYTI